jgi:hypothetical protein
MNTDTGQVYRTQVEIDAAQARGEPLARVSERVADAVEIGMSHLNRHERRKAVKPARSGRKRT